MSDATAFDGAAWDASQNDRPIPLIATLGVAAMLWIAAIAGAASVLG